jgi:acetyltransferase
LATDFEIYKGAFKQAGIELADSFSSAFGIKEEDVTLKGKKVSIVTNAGGAGALATDYFVGKGYDVSAPIDVLGTAVAADYRDAFEKLKKSKPDSVVVILTPQSMSQPDDIANEIVKFSKSINVAAMLLGRNSVKSAVEILKKNNVQVVTDI